MSSTTVWCPWVMNILTCTPDSTSRSYFEFSNTRLASHPYKFICQKWHQKPSLGFCFWLNVCGRYGWLIAFVADSFWPKWAKGVIRVFGLQLPRAVDWLELSQSHGNQLDVPGLWIHLHVFQTPPHVHISNSPTLDWHHIHINSFARSDIKSPRWVSVSGLMCVGVTAG